MALTNDRKRDEIKAMFIERVDKVGTLAALKTLIKNLTWANIKSFIQQDLQKQADNCDLRIQEWIDKKAEYLALKDELDAY